MGKSLVRKAFKDLGAYTLDADEIVGQLLKDPIVLQKISHILGPDVISPDGVLLKDVVADKIFRDETLRMTIEDLLHPLVFGRVDELLRQAAPEVAVVEATLIFERGHEGRFDLTVAVITDEDTALERLAGTGIDRDEALKRLLCQMPTREKAGRADFIVDNSGTPDATVQQVRDLYKKLTKTA